MAKEDELQASTLREVIERLEDALKSGAKRLDEFLLKGELSNKRSELAAATQHQEHVEKEKKEEKNRELAYELHLVEQEIRLNAEEKEQYAGFLSQQFFTKADFDKLESFYANTWDKLTDEGKAQMSQRVWEGIRQGEYTFGELPETVRKKESEWLYLQITGEKESAPWVSNIPEQDRQEFKRAYEAKDEKAVIEILERPSVVQAAAPAKVAIKEADATKEVQSEAASKSEDNQRGQKEASAVAAAFTDEEISPVNPSKLPPTGSVSRSPI